MSQLSRLLTHPLIIAAFLTASCSHAENSVVPNRIVRIVSATAPWMVFLPGSECEHYDQEDSRWVTEIARGRSFNLLVIEKRGVLPDGNCNRDEFHAHSLREVRIADIRDAMDSQLPSNAKILLVAESEGGYIAPDIALADARVKSLIELSGGTKSWIDEEISFVPITEQAELRRYFEEQVIGHPDLHRFYHEWTYAELNSYHTHQTYESLKLLEIPILMLNGDKDHLTWVNGTIEDIEDLKTSGKTNIEMHVFPGANHALECELTDSRCEAGALRSSQNRVIRRFVNAF